MKISAPLSRLPGLDTLRAAAIVAVMLYHLTIFGELPERILPVTYFGYLGVDLFFVLSGFLIGRQLLKPYLRGRRPSLRDFYLRRAWRILPAYLVVVGLYALVPAWREFPRIPPLWKLLTFTENIGFSFADRGFSHAWSLCVEEHFYLLLPLLVVLLMRRPSLGRTVALIVALVAGGIVLRAWLLARYPDEVWPQIYYPTYTRLDGLIAGVSLALVSTFRPAWWHALMRRGHSLFFTGAACVAIEIGLLRNEDLGNNTGPAKWALIIGFPLLAAGLALITASAMSENGWLARVRVPGAQMLAALAFCLYLTHKSVGHLVMESFPRIVARQGPVSWLLYAAACWSAAWLLHALVERPCLRLRDRRLRPASSAALEGEMRTDPAL